MSSSKAPEQLLKLKMSVVQRSGQASHPGLFGALTHEALQGLMKRQPLLHRGFEGHNPPARKSRRLKAQPRQSVARVRTSRPAISPFVLGGIFGAEVEGLELVRGRFQLDAGLLGSVRLLPHRVSLQVDPT